MKKKLDLSLYLVANKTPNLSEESFLNIIEEAIKGGVSVVQLRDKMHTTREFYFLGLKVKQICAKYNTTFIVNDRLDIALALDADGLHIGGQNDLPINVARKVFGDDKIIGLSLNKVEEIKNSVGADYLGCGAIVATPTKQDARVLERSILNEIIEKSNLPCVAIGGIDEEVIKSLKGVKIAGVAVVRAILNAKNPREAAANLLKTFKV